MAWHYGGEDPYRLYHGLDADYRPLASGVWADAEASARALADREERPYRPHEGLPAMRRPEFPGRVRAFMYACAKVSAIMDERMKNTNEIGRAAVKAIRAGEGE